MTEVPVPKNRMPHSIEAELALLGTIFNDPNLIDRVIDELVPGDFYMIQHQQIYELILDYARQDKPINEVLMNEEFVRRGFDISPSYILDVSMHAVPEDNLPKWLFIIKEHSDRRSMYVKLQRMLAVLVSSSPHSIVMEEVERNLVCLSVRQKYEKSMPEMVKDTITSMMQQLDEKLIIKTGLTDLDQMTGGFFPGEMVVIAARPAVGKTSLALSACMNMVNAGKHVGFISLEMVHEELIKKIISMEGDIPFSVIRSGRAKETGNSNYEKFVNTILRVERMHNLYIKDDARTIAEIKNYARKKIKERKLDILVIDYLGLVSQSFGGKGQSLYQEVGGNSRALKQLAMELKIPIIVIHQLNRESMNRQDPKPMMHDLRDSGQIEQDADMILLLHRQHMIDKEYESLYDAQLIVAKSRYGATGEINLHFEPAIMKFSNQK